MLEEDVCMGPQVLGPQKIEKQTNSCHKQRRETVDIENSSEPRIDEIGINCTLCHVTFQNKSDLERHMQSVHGSESESEQHACDLCAKQFKTNDCLTKHRKLCYESLRESFDGKCTLCETKFTVFRSLIRHMKANHHGKPSSFECTGCGKHFKRKDNLQAHMSSCIRLLEQKRSERVKGDNSGPKDDGHNCALCGSSFELKIDLSEHVREIHGSACDLCGKKIKTSVALMEHRNSCRKDLMIPIIKNKTVGNHVGNHHLECSICGKSFSTRWSFRSHMRRVHLKENKLFKCICGKELKQQCTFTRHKNNCIVFLQQRERVDNSESGKDIQSTDSDGEVISFRYKCALCAKQLKRKEGLVKHMQIHRKKWIDWHMGVSKNKNERGTLNQSNRNPAKKSCETESIIQHSEVNKEDDDSNSQESQNERSAEFDAGLKILRPWKSKAEIGTTSSVPSVKEFKCVSCKSKRGIVAFDSRFQLERHIHLHHWKAYGYTEECKVCHVMLKSKGHLRTHYTEVHGDLTCFKCDLCIATRTSLDGIKTHMRQNHITEMNGSVEEDSPPSNMHEGEQSSTADDDLPHDGPSTVGEDQEIIPHQSNEEVHSNSNANTTSNEKKDESPKLQKTDTGLKLKQHYSKACDKKDVSINESSAVERSSMEHSEADGDKNSSGCIQQQHHSGIASQANSAACGEELELTGGSISKYGATTCGDCGIIFCSIHALNVHIMEAHLRKKYCLVLDYGGEVFKFKFSDEEDCRYCNEQFCSSFGRDEHEMTHFGDDKPYKCTMCNAGFGYPSALINHMVVHIKLGLYICVQCNISFEDYHLLSDHKWVSHFTKTSVHLVVGFLRKLMCRKCNRYFASHYYLKRHISEGLCTNQILCTFCGKNYNSRSTLKMHVRQHHTGERPYKCSFCDKTFAAGPFLRQHEESHTGKKEMLCHVCGKTFKGDFLLIRHMKIHTGVKTHKCEICGFEFNQGCSLKRHMMTHTKKKPS